MNFFHIVLDIHAQNRKICLREEGKDFNGLQFLILGTRLLTVNMEGIDQIFQIQTKKESNLKKR